MRPEICISAILPGSDILYQFLSFLSSLFSALQAVIHGLLNSQSCKSSEAKTWDRQALHWWMEFLLKIEDMNLVFDGFCRWVCFTCFTAFPFWKLRRHILGKHASWSFWLRQGPVVLVERYTRLPNFVAEIRATGCSPFHTQQLGSCLHIWRGARTV